MADKIRRCIKVLALCGLALASLSGCKSPPLAAPGLLTAAPVAELNQSQYSVDLGESYVLRPGDTVIVRVFREEGLSPGEIRIAADGSLSLPLIGTMQVAGLTLQQVEAAAESALSQRYLRNADVSITMAQYGSHQVTVEGAVRMPGVYQFSPGARLSSGLALASGFDRVASLDEVVIFRQTSRGMEVAKFDYLAVRQGTMIDPVLVPGDRIVVGLNGLSQAYQDLLRAIPVFALFTQI
jgi:polysaccharide export outer membrane protein